MISPEEIREQALRWWRPLLQSHIEGVPFFPRQIDRIGKVRPGHVTARLEALQQEIEVLYQHSKEATGKGYLVKTAARNFRRTGAHEVPDSIVFETTADYLHVTRKAPEWRRFCAHYELLIHSIPQLREWALANPLWLAEENILWPDVLKVCRYFLATPRPNLYLRQLPVEVHTKFIEEHGALLSSLLDFLLPEHIRDSGQKRFADRYFLKYDEPSVRLRILDSSLAIAGSFADIQIPLSDFERTAWPAGRVLITENKMNFLALPALPGTMAIWSGGGFQVSFLKNVGWLADKNIYYWGDIDEHGFQILHQIRSYFPDTKSVMMDSRTFKAFSQYAVAGKRNPAEMLHHLTDEEAALYRMLKSSPDKNRLEQEKISQGWADAVLQGLN